MVFAILGLSEGESAAVYALIGVVVGGVLNGAVAVWQDRRRERRAARPAARAVIHELSEMQAILGADAHREHKMGVVPSPRAWPEHYMTLAGVVDGVTWTAVAAAYAMAEYVTPREEGTVPIRALYSRAWLPHEISQGIHKAQRRLKRYADLPRGWEPLPPVRSPS